MLLTNPVVYSSGLPKRVKIGPLVYEVNMETAPYAEIEGKEVPVFGLVNFRKEEITVADDISIRMQWQCYFHEIFHVFFEQMGLEEPGEGQIDCLAYMLLGFLIDNGFLVEGEMPEEFPAMENLLNPKSSVFPFPNTKEKAVE